MKKRLRIKYRAGYKYQLAEDYEIKLNIFPIKTCGMRFLLLEPNGTLTIKTGYAWDGPSGPTYDTNTFMRGSLIHDAYYQLMRNNKISIMYRAEADRILKKLCKEDGMSSFRAWYVYKVVRFFGGAKSRCEIPTPIEKAP
jgi:hypothetical protein